MTIIQAQLKDLPKSPGVYMYYDREGNLLYIGKATSLKDRVKSYFVGAHDTKTEQLVSQIVKIKYRKTNSVIEATILEANLIKKYQPKYNILEKDDRSFVQIALTREEFPRLILLRPTEIKNLKLEIRNLYGPYTSAAAAHEIMAIFRKVFTFRDCPETKFNNYKKRGTYCLFYPLNLCPAPCAGNISKKEYKKIISQITDFLEGKTKRVISSLKKQMRAYSKAQKYEQAAKIRNRIFAFEHINDVALIKKETSLEQYHSIPKRIEAYDISNISGKFAVGSMVVFSSGEVDKNEYRKFKIKSANFPDDPKMMSEIISRRFNHPEWSKPDLIILDGGKGQLSAALNILRSKKISVPVIAVAKGPTRKGFRLFKNTLAKRIVLDKLFIERIRDESHRFAISYHRKLRSKNISI